MNKTEINKPCKVPIEHKIILKDDNPISLPMRRIPNHIRDKVKEKVDDLIEKNFVEYSDSPYDASLVSVVKKNGDIRLCFDYRKLNEKTIPRKFPIPRPDEVFDKLNNKKVFSVLDLKNGYYHIAIRPKIVIKQHFHYHGINYNVLEWLKVYPVPHLHLQKVLCFY